MWHLYLGNTVSSWHTGLLNHTVHVASHQTEACDSFWILCNVLTSGLGAGCCLLLLFSIHNFLLNSWLLYLILLTFLPVPRSGKLTVLNFASNLINNVQMVAKRTQKLFVFGLQL